MSMSGATWLSVLIVCFIPIVIAFIATEVDEYNSMDNGDHIKKRFFRH